MSHRKEKAGAADGLGQIQSVLESSGQRLIANDVDAGFEKGLRWNIVQMVRSHDGDGINAIFSIRLRQSHFRETAVSPLRDDVQIQRCSPSPRGIGR